MTWRRWALAAALVGVVCVAFLVVRSFVAAAAPTGRGAVAALPDRPAALNGPAVTSALNALRTQAQSKALTSDHCLDGLAQSYAEAISAAGAGPAPVTLAPRDTGTCGAATVRFGWAAGADVTGVDQARAAVVPMAGEASPLVSGTFARLGTGMAVRRVRGQVTGYVLAWVVAP